MEKQGDLLKTFLEMSQESKAIADKFRAIAKEHRETAANWDRLADGTIGAKRANCELMAINLRIAATQNEQLAERFDMHAVRQAELAKEGDYLNACVENPKAKVNVWR